MNAWLTLNDRKGAVCRALLAAVSGAAATLGFAPYGLWFMTVIGGAAVFYAVEKSRSVREAAGLGWLWGVTYFATGLSWTHRAMAIYGGVGDVVAAAVAVPGGAIAVLRSDAVDIGAAAEGQAGEGAGGRKGHRGSNCGEGEPVTPGPCPGAGC